MPHKHTRRKGGDDSSFNLAPSAIAKPLPSYAGISKKQKNKKNTPKPQTASKNGYKHDDTPRAFARMMELQSSKKRQRSGLDDGQDRRSAKKQKQKQKNSDSASAAPNVETVQEKPRAEMPKILPGERLGDFAARVDQALPVGGLARKGKVNVEGMKERQTKTEKRLHKMYAEWRQQDAKRKEQEEERREQEEEAEEEREAEHGNQTIQFLSSNRKAKRKKVVGETAGSDDEDPWAQLKSKRETPKGLHDVVQAPPTFRTVPKEKFKVRNGAGVRVENVPGTAGSLKRREELGETRMEVIERYRKMMGKGG